MSLFSASLVSSATAGASTPGSGTLSFANATVGWQSPVYASGTFGGPSSCPASDTTNAVCDHFDLTVDVPASHWDDTPEGGVPVSIRWERPTEDFDLYIYDASGKEVAQSAGTADPEVALIPRASGLYHVLVVPYDVTNNSYTGSAYLPSNNDAGNLTSFTEANGTYDIAAGSAKAKVYFTSDNQLRLQVAPDGLFTDPAGTEIVRTPPRPLTTTRYADRGAYYAISSRDAVLRVYKSPLRFGLYKADDSTVIWQEDKPLRWTDGAIRQSLLRGASEQFFGAGEQNGSFSHRDKVVNVSNNFNWNEGGYNNSQPFYLSSNGYGVFRNTFAPGQYNFGDPVRTGQRERRLDAYYFVGDAKSVIGQYTDLVGKPFMPPVYGLEAGDSDCYLHNANRGERHTLDALKIADQYVANQMPNGWMLVNDGYGCGYENLAQTGEGLRKDHMQLGLWTQDGLPNQADEVKAGVRVRKLDVAWVGNGYQFALDACDEAKAGIEDNSDARGFVWLPVSWAGAQRCGVLWSGDQRISWDYVRWQIPTYAGATMSGIAYNTGDVGGIFGSDAKTHTRDLQWKTFIPTIMTMDGWGPKNTDKQPFTFGEPYTSINRKYLQLKERLLPYTYALAAAAHADGVGAVRPLALEYPNDPVAATDAVKYEFLYGKDFLVAPVYADTATRDGIYLPEGTWVDYWTGKTYTGPTTVNGYHAPLDTLPLFVRAGAIVPMWPQGTLSWETRDRAELDFDVYARGDNSFTLYEDDGVTRGFQRGASATQQVRVVANGSGAGDTRVTVGASVGQYSGKVARRAYRFSLHVGAAPATVLLDGKPLPRLSTPDSSATGWYVDQAGVVQVRTPQLDTSTGFALQLPGSGGISG
ncbi:MAG TPA: TIM-barrel domain-containing protein [Actinokineospora sp.]|nr:TIM-barrel domain-containing protein [Actinokineospora sp.]